MVRNDRRGNNKNAALEVECNESWPQSGLSEMTPAEYVGKMALKELAQGSINAGSKL
jgi:hypothetical protein